MKPPVDETLTGDAAARSKEPVGPRRKLLQVRYSEQSLQDQDFLQYLHRNKLLTDFVAQTDETASSTKAKELTQEERNALNEWFVLQRSADRRVLVLESMQNIKTRLGSIEKVSPFSGQSYPRVESNYRQAPLNAVLKSLAQRVGLSYQPSEAVLRDRAKVNGRYEGDALEVFSEIALANKLQVWTTVSGGQLFVFTVNETNPKAGEMVLAFSEAKSSQQEIDLITNYVDLVGLLSNGEEASFLAGVKRLAAPKDGLQASQAYATLLAESERLQSTLRTFDQVTLNGPTELALSEINKGSRSSPGKLTDSDLRQVKESLGNFGLLDPKVCEGEEIVTERVFIYSETPKSVREFIESFFTGIPLASKVEQSPAEKNAQAPDQSSGSSSPKLPADKPTENPGTQPMSDIAQAGTCKPYVKDKPVILEDPLGLIVSGTRTQIDMAVKLADGRDIPSKQVLAEVFLVEVTKDWDQTIKTSLERTASSSLANRDPLSALWSATTQLSSTGFQSTVVRNRGNSNLELFISLLEQNRVGRRISSPTLVARDGEVAKIERNQTLRKAYLQTSTVRDGDNPPVETVSYEIKELAVPFTLALTPTIKHHNNHVVFKFEYKETAITERIEADLPASSTSEDVIVTSAETAPGDVIVLAGLYQDQVEQETAALPGVSRLGPLAGLLGGSNTQYQKGSELLVFIRPTVIEPRAQSAQLNSVK